MRRYLLALAALAMVFGFAPNAMADKPSETGNEDRPCELVDEHPLCVDGVFLPPGLGGPNPGCENAKEGQNPNCGEGEGEEPPAEEDPAAAECPPSPGPVTGVGTSITAEIAANGGEALAGPLDEVLCGVNDATGL